MKPSPQASDLMATLRAPAQRRRGSGRGRELAAPRHRVEETAASRRKRLVRAALEAIAQLPDIRTERVEAVRVALASGAYKPSAAAIAARLAKGVRLNSSLLWRR